MINLQSSSITPEFDRKPTSNTIAYYPLTKESALLDKTQNTTGTGYNISYEEILGSLTGVRFNGSNNSYVDISGCPTFDNIDFTISMWIKWNTIGADSIIFHRGTSDSTNRDLHLIKRSTNIFDLGFYSNDCAGSYALSSNTWYCIVCAYQSSTRYMRVYVNGALYGGRTGSGNPNFGTPNCQIGSKHGATTNSPTNGIMSRLIIDKAFWSEEQQLSYYNRFKKQYGIS